MVKKCVLEPVKVVYSPPESFSFIIEVCGGLDVSVLAQNICLQAQALGEPTKISGGTGENFDLLKQSNGGTNFAAFVENCSFIAEE